MQAPAEAATAAESRTAAQAGVASSRALISSGNRNIDEALLAAARRLDQHIGEALEANRLDLQAAQAAGMRAGLLDRLRLTPERVRAMGQQLELMAGLPHPQTRTIVRNLDDGLVLEERRRPVGVIGANFEARPNVVVDIAAQLLKSRNAGVLRTGSAALRSAAALVDLVISPALAEVGLDPGTIQLIRTPGHDSAEALVSMPDLIPLVILRGSGESTRHLARLGATRGVRTLSHADGGAVIYLDRAADLDLANKLVEASLDRLGVCNRLNLLLLHQELWDSQAQRLADRLAARVPAIGVSLPPHDHPLGYEWALDEVREATVTVAPAADAADAARIANEHTSGLAAAIVTEDRAAAETFLGTYAGTGAFWNASPRLLDGYRMLAIPETGINLDRVPGPRGPVTFQDLYLRQYVVLPTASG